MSAFTSIPIAMSNPGTSTSTAQVSAQIGGIPTTALDVPVSAVYLALFFVSLVSHATIIIRNQRSGHKFIFNGLCCGYSMSRILACVMRIVWATQPTNTDVALVASVFLNAGVLLLYIMNVFFAWRMVRSTIPSFGWNPVARLINKIALWVILPMILPLIVIIVLLVKSPTTPHVRDASTVLTRLAQTYFIIIALAPAFLLTIAVLNRPVVDPFGSGQFKTKVIILAVSIAGALIEAGFRCGTAWTPTPLASDPAWWDSKAAFYNFNFTVDICILLLFVVARIDLRFYVPNGANGPMSYSKEESQRRQDGEKDAGELPREQSMLES